MKLFSDEERRGLMVLLPLVLVAILLSLLVERRGDRPVMLAKTDESETPAAALSPFDPNEADYEELRRCGVPPRIAAGIIRLRSYGKVYRIKEDVASVSGVDDSLYAALKPYIVISEKHAAAPREKTDYPSERHRSEYAARPAADEVPQLEPFAIDTASAAYLAAIGFSPRQAEVIVRYREASGGIRDAEQFRKCYVVSDRMAERLLPYIVFTEKPAAEDTAPTPAAPAAPERIEINSADSATLRSVVGIGEKSVAEIMRYRELLGGFSSVEQLAELKCVTESNYERILPQIRCDSCKISKIDINFADPKELMRHPYVSAKALRRIVKQRKLKGGWSGIEEMIEDDIFTKDEAERLAPYLRFGLCAD